MRFLFLYNIFTGICYMWRFLHLLLHIGILNPMDFKETNIPSLLYQYGEWRIILVHHHFLFRYKDLFKMSRSWYIHYILNQYGEGRFILVHHNFLFRYKDLIKMSLSWYIIYILDQYGERRYIRTPPSLIYHGYKDLIKTTTPMPPLQTAIYSF